MEMKRCSRCKTEKELADFSKDKYCKDGFRSWCRSCNSEQARKWARLNPEQKRRQNVATHARYVADGRNQRAHRSFSGVVRGMKSAHGLSSEVAHHWAGILTCPTTRCSICGIPNQILLAYTEHGSHWILGRARRLTLDHVNPGVNDGNYRPLCFACNRTRGAAKLTDEEVLDTVRKRWQWSIGLRFLFWMNKSPGVGGRLNRSEACRKRDAQFAAGTTPEPLPTTHMEESP